MSLFTLVRWPHTTTRRPSLAVHLVNWLWRNHP